MSDTPADIMFNIFSRFSVNTIGQCRCVCKTWCNLLSDPYFVNLHLSKSPSCLIICKYQIRQSPILRLLDIGDELNHHGEPARTWDHKVGKKLYLEGSINGLLCLCDVNEDDTYIFNPILREYALLSKHKHVRTNFLANVSYGFGLCPTTSQYKVVRIFQSKYSGNNVSECEVYTLGTDTWRSVRHSPTFSIGNKRGILLNGGLHWLYSEINPEIIVRFDLETEEFHVICSIPPFDPEKSLDLSSSISLDELGGRLCIFDYRANSEDVIWVMKEYGLMESWSKEFEISQEVVPQWFCYEGVSALKVLNDGSLLMLCRSHDCFITYCPVTGAFKDLCFGFSTDDRIYEAMDYVPSILSLKNIVLENVQLF